MRLLEAKGRLLVSFLTNHVVHLYFAPHKEKTLGLFSNTLHKLWRSLQTKSCPFLVLALEAINLLQNFLEAIAVEDRLEPQVTHWWGWIMISESFMVSVRKQQAMEVHWELSTFAKFLLNLLFLVKTSNGVSPLTILSLPAKRKGKKTNAFPKQIIWFFLLSPLKVLKTNYLVKQRSWT